MSGLKDQHEFTNLKKVFLLLGPHCNMHCRHCSQSDIKFVKTDVTQVAPSVWDFLDSFLLFSSSASDMVRTLIFWGGEPLLHWDFLKDVIIRYTDKYNLLEKPMFRFSFVTNGLLIDEEKIKFLNKYHVYVSFSYDAPDPFAVRGYVSDDVCDKMNKIEHLVTMSTFNALNCDYYLALRCLRKKFPNARHNFNFALLHTFCMPEDVYTYDLKKVKNSLRKLRIASMKHDADADKMLMNIIWPLAKPSNFYYQRHQEWFEKYEIKPCFSCSSGLSVDLKGNIVSCHNSVNKVATVSDDFAMIQDSLLDVYRSNKSSECKDCEHNDICMGICSSSLQDKDGHYLACSEFRKDFFRMVKEEALKLLQPLSLDDDLWFKREYEKDDDVVKIF